MPPPSFIQKLKTRWKLRSGIQVVLVLLVFACTGISVMFLKRPLYDLAGMDAQTSAWIKVPFYIITVLPTYQAMLLLYGFLFGQFHFFWDFEKRLFRRLFSKKQKKSGV